MHEQSIQYGLLAKNESDAMVSLLAETFVKNDPLAVAVGLEPQHFEAFVRTLLPHVLEDDLTIVARIRDTGELVGAMLSEDAASEPTQPLQQISEKFGPVADILGQLGDEYAAGQAPIRGEKLHLYLLGVADHAAGHGVGQKLVTLSLENGARRGYRVAVAEATNRRSQRIFSKLGFVPRVQRSYADHVFDGTKHFASIAEEGGPILMDKVIAEAAKAGSAACG